MIEQPLIGPAFGLGRGRGWECRGPRREDGVVVCGAGAEKEVTYGVRGAEPGRQARVSQWEFPTAAPGPAPLPPPPPPQPQPPHQQV
jgi:hypothetical protein